MKERIYYATLFFNFLLFINYSFALPSNGLVAALKFNGNARDSSGNNNHGNVVGAVLTADRFGHPGSAYEFDGKSSIQVNAPLLGVGVFTVAVWVNVFPGASSGMEIISQRGEGAGTRYLLSTKKIRVSNKFNIYAESSLGEAVDASGTTTPIRNRWYHVVQTYDGRFLKLYINGSRESVITFNMEKESAPGPMRLLRIGQGMLRVSGNPGFIGKVDDVYIYSRALTEKEIRALYTAVPGMIPEPPLLLLFTLGLFGIIYFKRKPSRALKKRRYTAGTSYRRRQKPKGRFF